MNEQLAVAGAGPATDEVDSNGRTLFIASFLTLIAAGIGFSVRGAILGDWGRQFGFTQGELGTITGGGLVGFGITIILFSMIADRIGYAPLMGIAFFFHVASAVVTFAATPMFNAYGKDGAFWCLNIGMWLFAFGNGTCEAVINPMTADLYPKNKTHWLNILHAGWPAGLVLGALLGLGFGLVDGIPWEVKLGTFLIPTLAYGIMMLGRKFPRSVASAAGVPVGTMLLEFASPILLFLLLLHAMVGYVELGTDSWIINITETILNNGSLALLAFIWTNILMTALRFFAGPIVHQISPLGLLFASAVLGTVGLYSLGQVPATIGMWMLAVTVYGVGKTFFWPTMLGVVAERFPKGGALTLGVVGGVGMLSAGLLGGPGIGYAQDLAAMRYLSEKEPATYARFKGEEKSLYGVTPAVAGLDNSKVGTLLGEPGKNNGNGKLLEEDMKNVVSKGRKVEDIKPLKDLDEWWQKEKPHADEDRAPLLAAKLYAGQKALTWTAAVPAAMAVGYLILLIYFRAIGGYSAQVLAGHAAEDEKFTGGTQGPGEG